MMDVSRVWIVIPTYNEAVNLPSLLLRIGCVLPGVSVLIIDDHSPDGTGAIAEQQRKEFSGRLEVLHREKKRGIGSAYRDGFRFALNLGAQFLIEMDADGSHDPEQLPVLLRCMEGGADVAVGSRRVAGGGVEGWSVWRKAMSAGAVFLSRKTLGLQTKDVTSGYKCYRRMVIESFHLEAMESDGYAFQEETIFLAERKGFQIREIPIQFRDRSRGRSKLSRSEIVKFFIQIFRLKFHSR